MGDYTQHYLITKTTIINITLSSSENSTVRTFGFVTGHFTPSSLLRVAMATSKLSYWSIYHRGNMHKHTDYRLTTAKQ